MVVDKLSKKKPLNKHLTNSKSSKVDDEKDHSYINIWGDSLLLDNKALSLSDEEVVELIEANIESNKNIVQGSVAASVDEFKKSLKKCSLSFNHKTLGEKKVEFIVFSIRNSGDDEQLLRKRVQVPPVNQKELNGAEMKSVCIYKTGESEALFVGIEDNNFWKSEADNVTSAWFDLKDLYCLFKVGSFAMTKGKFRGSDKMKQYFTRDLIDFLFIKKTFKKNIQNTAKYNEKMGDFDRAVKKIISNKKKIELFLEQTTKDEEGVKIVNTLKFSREAEELVYKKIISKSSQRLNKFTDKKSVVLWLNQVKESYRPLDILIENEKKPNVFIEVKTTQKKQKSFFLSKKEKELLLKTINNKNEYFLVLVWNYKGGETNNIIIYSADEIKEKKGFKEITSYFYNFSK